MMSGRGQRGLSEREIQTCRDIWDALQGNLCCALDTSSAYAHGSKTLFKDYDNIVYLGADVVPGVGTDARSRLSELACLAHELAHAERFKKDYNRPTTLPAKLIDEAETSLHASFTDILGPKDREDLVEDARDRIIEWLAAALKKEAET